MENMRVKCDLCGWFEFMHNPSLKKVKAWYNVPCPRCGKSVIINDYDLSMYKAIRILSVVSRILHIVSFGLLKLYKIKIDTAKGETK